MSPEIDLYKDYSNWSMGEEIVFCCFFVVAVVNTGNTTVSR